VNALAVICIVAAVLIGLPRAPRRRLRELFAEADGEGDRPRRGLSDPRMVRIISAVGGLGVALTIGGLWGWGFGIAIAVGAPVMLGRLESRRDRERREAMERQGADAADLLAACLASGAPIPPSAAAVARALGEPIAEPLNTLVASLSLGADQVDAWRAIATQPGMDGLARAVARSLESGAPLSQTLPGIADDLRRSTRGQVEAAARAAGVRAVAPLAACFLPAFLLVGVVPIVASLALPYLTG
jgi:pilus assembly protein TadC